mmetsp:Transcript_14126/g.40145  ORF Transcript_14126/g.40145 Transcript_14126/m.40145 type:complete len:728 (-) Transcript_14126:92-2275(-)
MGKVVLKLRTDAGMRRVMVDESVSLAGIDKLVEELFPEEYAVREYRLTYRDEDGDEISVTTSMELREAVAVVSASALRAPPVLRLTLEWTSPRDRAVADLDELLAEAAEDAAAEYAAAESLAESLAEETVREETTVEVPLSALVPEEVRLHNAVRTAARLVLDIQDERAKQLLTTECEKAGIPADDARALCEALRDGADIPIPAGILACPAFIDATAEVQDHAERAVEILNVADAQLAIFAPVVPLLVSNLAVASGFLEHFLETCVNGTPDVSNLMREMQAAKERAAKEEAEQQRAAQQAAQQAAKAAGAAGRRRQCCGMKRAGMNPAMRDAIETAAQQRKDRDVNHMHVVDIKAELRQRNIHYHDLASITDLRNRLRTARERAAGPPVVVNHNLIDEIKKAGQERRAANKGQERDGDVDRMHVIDIKKELRRRGVKYHDVASVRDLRQRLRQARAGCAGDTRRKRCASRPRDDVDKMSLLEVKQELRRQQVPCDGIVSVSDVRDLLRQHRTKQQADAAPSFAHCALCDACNRRILGTRYKCINCADFDLCADCEAEGTHHLPTHAFVKLGRHNAHAFRFVHPQINKRFQCQGRPCAPPPPPPMVPAPPPMCAPGARRGRRSRTFKTAPRTCYADLMRDLTAATVPAPAARPQGLLLRELLDTVQPAPPSPTLPSAPEETPEPAKEAEAENPDVEMLVNMGFDKAQAQLALLAHGDLDGALDYLLSQ